MTRQFFPALAILQKIAVTSAVAAMLLASACGGGGGTASGPNPRASEADNVARVLSCPATSPTCSRQRSEYDDGETLALNPDGEDMSFNIARTFGEMLSDSDNDFDDLDDSDTLIDDEVIGVIDARIAVYCTKGDGVQAQAECEDYENIDNYALGYSINIREPALEDADEDNDKYLTMAGFTLLTSTVEDDFLVFGAAVGMQSITVSNSATSYRPLLHTGFVFGQPAANLPTSGLAAYAGFSQAYAQSDNRLFNPFQPAGSTGGGILANGFAAMVFEFDGSGARFRHGFIDLGGRAFIDNGDDDKDIPDTIDVVEAITQHHLLRTNTTLNANFDDPGYRSTSFVTTTVSLDASLINAGQYEENPMREYYLDPDYVDSDDHASGLFFRLDPDTTTADRMDFTMRLQSFVDPNAPSCLPSNTDVKCYDSDSAGLSRRGVLDLYGSLVTLNNANSGNARSAPSFAGGVWQYEGILYVDPGDDNAPGGTGNNEDTLLGIVDLYGSLGGFVVDQPAE